MMIVKKLDLINSNFWKKMSFFIQYINIELISFLIFLNARY